MKTTILPTRHRGVAYQRGELKQASTYEGELEILDSRENSFNRIIKVARLSNVYGTRELFEAHVVWMSGDRICFSGFERCQEEGRWVDYAQSWICLLNGQCGYDNEGLLSSRPKDDWRRKSGDSQPAS